MTTSIALPTYSSAVQSFVTVYTKEANRLLVLKNLMDRSAGNCSALCDQHRLGLLTGDPLMERLKPTIKEALSFRKEERCAKEVVRSLYETSNHVRTATHLSQPTGQTDSEEALQFEAVRGKIAPLLEALAARVDKILNDQVIPNWNRMKDVLENALQQAELQPGFWGAVRGTMPTYMGGVWPRVEVALADCERQRAASAVEAPAEPSTGTPLSFQEEERALTPLLDQLKTLIEKYPSSKPPAPASPPAGAATLARSYAAVTAGIENKTQQ